MDFKCEIITIEKVKLENGDSVFRTVFLILDEKLNVNTAIALMMEKPLEVGREVTITINV
jgi:hypothetical protein